MAEKIEPLPEPERAGPEIVAPTNRITVAFPFSHISIGEPSEEMAEMVKLLEELSELVVKAAPGAKAEAIRRRAHALQARMVA
jgi:hypothetical protein